MRTNSSDSDFLLAGQLGGNGGSIYD
jgi:hypothetical protein